MPFFAPFLYPPISVEFQQYTTPQVFVPNLVAQTTGTSEPKNDSTIPSVIEFYYGDPNKIAVPKSNLTPVNYSAEQLKPPTQAIPVQLPVFLPRQTTALENKLLALSRQEIYGLSRDRPSANFPVNQRLLTQTRDGVLREFEFKAEESPVIPSSPLTIPATTNPDSSTQSQGNEATPATPTIETEKPVTNEPNIPLETNPGKNEPSFQPNSSPNPGIAEDSPGSPVVTPIIREKKIPEVVELLADQQEYDVNTEIVTATGKVVMRFSNGVLLADHLRVNLPDRFAVAEGNVVLTRGDQTIKGERFEYFFVQDKGVVFNANGEIYQPTTARDFAPNLPTDPGRIAIAGQTLNERLATNQPLQQVTPMPGLGVGIGGGLNLNQLGTAGSAGAKGGQVNRLRFQAQRMDFDSEGWNASKVRLTNDPFSPPELEVQAETAEYYNVGPQIDEVKLTDSKVVLDQKTSLPFQDRLTIDRRDRQPGIIGFGYDGQDRGGLFVQSTYTPVDNKIVRFRIKPQYLLQKAFFPDAFSTANLSESEVCVVCPSVFGLVTDLDVNLSDRSKLINTLNFSNLNLDQIDTSLRAKLAYEHKIGDPDSLHDLRVEYNYRERLFNGSLGFQTVNSSFGAVVVSPAIALGDPTFTLSYQASIQDIQADTDQSNLLTPGSDSNFVTLMRYQGAASISKSFFLWMGDPLPPEPDQGLRYSPIVIVPYVQLITAVTGVTSIYSDGSSQPSLTGTIGLQGQFGHFSESYLDYTGFNLIYQQALRGDESPFLFDRFADTQLLIWGLTQQVYGPVRIGVQSAYSINTSKELSTDYFLEYSRRTYNFQVRYNPQLQVGSINLRISDFNWSGNPGAFEGTDIRPVMQGITR